MGETKKNVIPLNKCVTLGEIGNSFFKWVLLKKRLVTLRNMGQNWQNGSHSRIKVTF